MKVLQVNCVYKKGSTGKITYDLQKGLMDAGIESIVCYGRGELVEEKDVYKICSEWYSKLNNAISRITGIMYGGCLFSTNNLISIIKKEKPDIVHLQCINGYFVNIYRLIHWLKKNCIKTVLTLHAEFMYTGGCGYALDCDKWSISKGCGDSGCPRFRSETKSLFLDRTGSMWRRMKKAFDGFDENLMIMSVSPWLMERAKKAPVLKGKRHGVIYNGLDTDIFHPYDTLMLKEQYGGQSQKIVFHATPFFSTERDHIKGGWYICEIAKRMPDVLFLIAGRNNEDITVPPNVILLGMVTEQSLLAQYYSMADVTIIASKRETFSMIVAESLCCGTPVVGFEAGGPEQIAIPEYSRFCSYGDVEELTQSVRAFLEMSKDDKLVSIAKDCYSTHRMVKQYIALYIELAGIHEKIVEAIEDNE